MGKSMSAYKYLKICRNLNEALHNHRDDIIHVVNGGSEFATQFGGCLVQSWILEIIKP